MSRFEQVKNAIEQVNRLMSINTEAQMSILGKIMIIIIVFIQTNTTRQKPGSATRKNNMDNNEIDAKSPFN